MHSYRELEIHIIRWAEERGIVEHDPKFSAVYLEEKRLLLDVLTNADPRLIDIARSQCR